MIFHYHVHIFWGGNPDIQVIKTESLNDVHSSTVFFTPLLQTGFLGRNSDVDLGAHLASINPMILVSYARLFCILGRSIYLKK